MKRKIILKKNNILYTKNKFFFKKIITKKSKRQFFYNKKILKNYLYLNFILLFKLTLKKIKNKNIFIRKQSNNSYFYKKYLPLFKLSKQFFFKNSNIINFLYKHNYKNFFLKKITNKLIDSNQFSIFFGKNSTDNLTLLKLITNLKLQNTKKTLNDNELIILDKNFLKNNNDNFNFKILNINLIIIMNSVKEIYKFTIYIILLKIFNY